MTPLTVAYRRLRVAVERIRVLALDAVAAVAEADAAGVCGDALLDALRLEHEDWNLKIPQMQIIAEMLSATGSRTRIDALIMVDDPIATRDEEIRYEQDQGFLAYHAGQRLGDNPYPRGSPANSSWHEGWVMARDKDL